MSKAMRRFEVMFPLRFNDGQLVPDAWIGEAMREIMDRFDGVSFETRAIQGRWRHAGVVYHDELTRFLVDVPDLPENREWMGQFKARWKERLQQLELWMVSYCVEVE